MKPKTKKRKPQTEEVGNVVVKIYQRRVLHKATRKKYTFWAVCDYTTGRRRMRSFGDLAEARNEAKRIANQLSTGQATAAQMLNTEAASYGRAIELLRPTGASLELACSAYAKAFEILGGDSMIEAAKFYARHRADQLTQRTVAKVVEELIAAKTARRKSDRYISDLSSRLTRFADDHAVNISSITTADVQRWLDGLKGAAQTAKNFRTVLYTLFKFADSRGYIFKGSNPAADTERIQTDEGAAIEIFAPDEMLKLLTNAPKDFVPFLALGAFAGLRSAEIERLEWSAVDLAGGFVHVAGDKAKTRSRRLVPVLPNLAAWLNSYAKHKGHVWKGTPDELRDARAETVEASGVQWKDNGLRHSFISYRLADIQNAAQVALEAGNSPDMVFKHYRELVKPAAAKTWFAIAPEAPENVVSLGAT